MNNFIITYIWLEDGEKNNNDFIEEYLCNDKKFKQKPIKWKMLRMSVSIDTIDLKFLVKSLIILFWELSLYRKKKII